MKNEGVDMEGLKIMMNHWQDFIPFAIATGASGDGGGNGSGRRPNYVRIFEALLISFVTGAVATYASTEVMKTEIRYLSNTVRQLDDKVEMMRRDLYMPRAVPRKESGPYSKAGQGVSDSCFVSLDRPSLIVVRRHDDRFAAPRI